MTAERDSLKGDLEKEKLKVKAAGDKYAADFQQLNFDAARSYGLGFEQTLVQIKHFNPEADISGCDPMKELVNNVLVDLGEGEEDPGSADHGNEEEIADSQGGEINKPTEDSNKLGNEEQGDAPLK
ncbi:F-box/kelch-repeat protein [Sesbania bispinosa]|nr:F-box/kelch-repeat protein [Sesbania bispinosa]